MRNYSIDEVPRGLELENIFAALKELKAYQDSGLSPEEIQKLQEKLAAKETINQLYKTTVSMVGSDKDILIYKVNNLQKELTAYRATGSAQELMKKYAGFVRCSECTFMAHEKSTGIHWCRLAAGIGGELNPEDGCTSGRERK
ncbi:MAG: hypothetical protein Q4D16_03405 [Eubacteriales bacterium]|nr:hypothetical protein [Eubacteriales bacterium]